MFARSNALSRRARVSGPLNVSIAGNGVVRANASIRGDLARVRLGRFCYVGKDAILSPPYRVDISLKRVPMTVGSHVIIGNGAIVEAAWIGVGVRIGDNAIIGKCVVIKDYCDIAADAVVPDDAVLAPCSIMAGIPARRVGMLAPGAVATRREDAERHIHRILSQ